MKYWINGTVKSGQGIELPLNSDAWLRGDGLFESIRIVGEQVYFLERHLTRISSSISRFSFPALDLAVVRTAISELVAGNSSSLSKMRLTYYRDGLLFISLSDASKKPESIRCAVDEYGFHSDSLTSGSKNSSYFPYMQRRSSAKQAGCDDVLITNSAGEIVESSLANVLFEVGSELITPPLGSGALPGITRALILDWFPDVIERKQLVSELNHISGAALLSSIHGLIPITEIAGLPLNISPKIRDLADRFEEKARNQPNYA